MAMVEGTRKANRLLGSSRAKPRVRNQKYGIVRIDGPKQNQDPTKDMFLRL